MGFLHGCPMLRAAAGAVCLAAAGCAGSPEAPTAARPGVGALGVDVTADTTHISEGSTVRLAAAPHGRGSDEATVQWETTGGRVTPDSSGRAAEARFERSGTYTVTALLLVGGQEVDRDSATIEVAPGGLLADRDRARTGSGGAARPASNASPARMTPAAATSPTTATPAGGTPAAAPDTRSNPDNTNKPDNNTKEDPG